LDSSYSIVNSITIYNALGSQVMKSTKGIESGINVSASKAGILYPKYFN